MSLATQVSYSFVYYRFVFFFLHLQVYEVKDAIRSDVTTFPNRRESYGLRRQSYRLMLFHIPHIKGRAVFQKYHAAYFQKSKYFFYPGWKIVSARRNYYCIYHSFQEELRYKNMKNWNFIVNIISVLKKNLSFSWNNNGF